MYEVFSGGEYERVEDLSKLGNIPHELRAVYQGLVNANPKNRLNPKKVLASKYFDHMTYLN